MTSTEDTVKKFYNDEINDCPKISLRICMKDILEEFYVDKQDIISLLWALNQFLQKNSLWFEGSESYFLSWKLVNISPILSGQNVEFQKFLKEINCSYRNNTIILFEESDLFFLLIRQDDLKLEIEIYYLIKNQTIETIEKDIKILKNRLKDTPEVVAFNLDGRSYDVNYNSLLIVLFLKKYSYIFSKQSLETKNLIKEIQQLFFEGFSENNKGKLIAVIALVTMIIEENLIRMYKKVENKRPDEGYNINKLNDVIAKNETVELRFVSGNNYQMLFKGGSTKPVLYNDKSRIYILIKDYANIIRNKVFHFQQSIALDLFFTSIHAIKYLVNILMEIENNDNL